MSSSATLSELRAFYISLVCLLTLTYNLMEEQPTVMLLAIMLLVVPQQELLRCKTYLLICPAPTNVDVRCFLLTLETRLLSLESNNMLFSCEKKRNLNNLFIL